MLASWLRRLAEDLTSNAFRDAVLLGLASIPFTVVLSWELVGDTTQIAGGTVSGLPMLVAGVLAGYRYGGRPYASRRAGLVTGLAGSIAVLVVYTFNLITTVESTSPTVTLAALVGDSVHARRRDGSLRSRRRCRCGAR